MKGMQKNWNSILFFNNIPFMALLIAQRANFSLSKHAYIQSIDET